MHRVNNIIDINIIIGWVIIKNKIDIVIIIEIFRK